MSTDDEMSKLDPGYDGRTDDDSTRPDYPRSDRSDGVDQGFRRESETRRDRKDGYGDRSPGRDRESTPRQKEVSEHRSSILDDLLSPFTDLYESVRETLRRTGPPRPDVVDRLRYRSVIAYFVEHAPPVVGAVRGMLLRQPHPKGWMVSQLFLAPNDQPYSREDDRPYGRKLIVRQFDDELEDLFGGRDMIIFE